MEREALHIGMHSVNGPTRLLSFWSAFHVLFVTGGKRCEGLPGQSSRTSVQLAGEGGSPAINGVPVDSNLVRVYPSGGGVGKGNNPAVPRGLISMTRRITFLALICVGFGALTFGCSTERVTKMRFHSNNAGIGENPDEHYNRLFRQETHARRALVDDLDVLFLSERPSRLTRWHE